MAQSDDLLVKVKADITAYQAGLRQAAKDAKTAGSKIEGELSGSMKRVSAALKVGAAAAGAALGALAIGAVAREMKSLFDQALETADGLQKLADKTGLSVEEIQRLRYAANQAGVSSEALDAAFGKFTQTLGNAQNGLGSAKKEFSALGVAITDQNGKFKSSDDVLLGVLRRLEQFPDASQRGAAAMGIFSKAGVEVATIASQGAGALDEFRAYADKAGIVIGADLVAAGDAAGDSLARLKFVITAGLNKAILQVAPEVEKFVNELLADPAAMQKRIQDLVDIGHQIIEIGGAAITAGAKVVKFAEDLGYIAKGFAETLGLLDYQTQLRHEIEAIDKALTANSWIDKPTKYLLTSKETLEALKGQTEEQLRQAQAVDKLVASEDKRRENANKPPPAAPGATGGGKIKPPPAYVDPQAQAEADAAARRSKADAAQIEQEHKKNQALIAQARDKFSTEAEIEAARYEMMRASLEALSDLEFGGAEKKNELLLALARDHSAEMQKIEDDAITTREDAIDAGETAIADRKKQRQEDLLGIVADNEAAQTLAETINYEDRLKALSDYSDAELEAVGGRQAAREALEAEHQDRMKGIAQSALKSNLEFLTWIEDQKARNAADGFANLLAIGGKNNKKLFKISQAIALANAIVTLPSAVIKSFDAAGGYPFGIPAAVAMAATGAAQIAAIKNASYGGGASSSVPGAAASGGGVVGDTNARVAPQLSLTLIGNNFSQEQVRQLATQLQEAYSDGAGKQP